MAVRPHRCGWFDAAGHFMRRQQSSDKSYRTDGDRHNLLQVSPRFDAALWLRRDRRFGTSSCIGRAAIRCTHRVVAARLVAVAAPTRYPQLHRARHPQHRVWGYDRKSGVSDFRLSKVCSFRLPLTPSRRERRSPCLQAIHPDRYRHPLSLPFPSEGLGRAFRQDPADTLRVQGQRHPNLPHRYKLQRCR